MQIPDESKTGMKQAPTPPDYNLDTNPLFQEWKLCQQSLPTYDKMILEIRKYGFTFLTLLLTADGYLLGQENVSKLSAISIYAVLLLLIFTLFRVDRMHEIFLRATVLRSMRLEEELGLGLTRTISRWSASSNTATWGFIVYILFCFAAFLLTSAAIVDKVDKISPETSAAVSKLDTGSLSKTIDALLTDNTVTILVITQETRSENSDNNEESKVKNLQKSKNKENTGLIEWIKRYWIDLIPTIFLLLSLIGIYCYHQKTQLNIKNEINANNYDPNNPFFEHIMKGTTDDLWKKKP